MTVSFCRVEEQSKTTCIGDSDGCKDARPAAFTLEQLPEDGRELTRVRILPSRGIAVQHEYKAVVRDSESVIVLYEVFQ